jgi:hypothetical protein
MSSEHLKKWCDKYFEKSGMKIHPSAVPVDVILNDLLGRVDIIEQRIPKSMNPVKKEEDIQTVRVRGVDIPLDELLKDIDKSKKVKK